MPTLSPYRRQLAIKRQIKTLEAESISISKAADLDRIVRGMRASARQGYSFDFDHVNEVCVCGIMVDQLGHRHINDLWDFAAYHAFITTETAGLTLSVHMDDGTISIQIGFKDRVKEPAALAAKLAMVRSLLKSYGVTVTAHAIKAKRATHASELAEMDTLIATVEVPNV